ncbi:hypothetical protein ACFQY0_13290 [Haloferula chungangensis]|uniref:Uncharacterized protein n=1 Tax=Haloferula chungangensis TaxID=1048331 RepID=A0ABW2LB52_9BACT
MILAFDIQDLPGEAVTVVLLLLFSFVSWLKSKFFDKPEEPEPFEDEEMREVIWRRQMGEDSEDTRMPWEPPKAPPTIRFDPPKPPPIAPPALPTQVREVSKRERDLANAFERSTRRKGGRRTSHRRKIDALLASPSAAKDAILLMEILGPPVAIKPEHQPEN